MNMKPVIYLLCMLSSCFLQGQNNDGNDKVILKNGTTYQGTIQSYSQNGVLVLRIEGTGNTSIPIENISEIIPNYRQKASLDVTKSNQLYFTFEFASLANAGAVGPSLQIGVYKNLGKNFALGVAGGINVYSFQDREISYPVFLTGRKYFTFYERNFLIDLSSGYGFIKKSDDQNIFGAKGGLMLNSKIGLQLDSGSIQFYPFLGFKYQKAEYKLLSWNGEFDKYLKHKRIEVGLGITF